MATVTARSLVRVVTTEGGVDRTIIEDVDVIADVVFENGRRETVTLANGFTALTVPTGSQAVWIRPLTGAFTFTLKGVTGDTGIVIGVASTLPILPCVLPLGTTPSIGITCTGAGTVEVIWL